MKGLCRLLGKEEKRGTTSDKRNEGGLLLDRENLHKHITEATLSEGRGRTRAEGNGESGRSKRT